MKKLLTILLLAFTLGGFSQEIKIFDSIIPKVTIEPTAMDSETVLAIFDTLKYYPSVGAFIENNSGLYPPRDVKKVFNRVYEIVLKDLTPFMEGTAVKVEGSTDYTDPDNPIVTEPIYWANSTPEDRTAWRVYWRNLPYNKNNEVPIDIVPIWNAHRLYK